MAAPLLVVRHGLAVPRDQWPHDDDRRPLVADGEEQADVLNAWLERQRFGVDRLLSSPALRCTATLEPLAARTGQPIRSCDGLRPGRVPEAAELARSLLAGRGGLLCTHGEVVPGLLSGLAADLDGPAPQDTAKGSVWLVALVARDAGVDTDGRLEARYLDRDELARATAR